MHDIIALNSQDLRSYITSEDYLKDKAIAITPHRAQSQLCNPLVKKEDILLLMIKDQGALVAYLGMMPGIVNYEDGSNERITWLTCLWVAEVGRGHRLSEKLIMEASRRANNKMLLGDYVPFTRKIYDRTGLFMDEIYSKHGSRWYIMSDLATILAPKHSLFSKMQRVLNLWDSMVNTFLTLRLKVIRQSSISFKQIQTLDEEQAEFINQNHRNTAFRRTAEEINWMLINPWITKSTVSNNQYKSKYYFSSSDFDFRYLVFEVRDKNQKITALAIFSKRNANLKLPYYYYSHDIADIVRLVESTILAHGIKTFTTYDADLAQSLKDTKSSIPIFIKSIQRNYRFANYFSDKIKLTDFSLMQDGEGDCGFT